MKTANRHGWTSYGLVLGFPKLTVLMPKTTKSQSKSHSFQPFLSLPLTLNLNLNLNLNLTLTLTHFHSHRSRSRSLAFMVSHRQKDWGFDVGGDRIDTGEDEINTGKKKATPAYVLVMSIEATFRRDCGGGVQMTIFVEREGWSWLNVCERERERETVKV